ncbi:MAG: hypothetical protein H7249_04040 [Chitinophagaceae bacterium]|nr:hypothetical protein [Oligoflexus sp.]
MKFLVRGTTTVIVSLTLTACAPYKSQSPFTSGQESGAQSEDTVGHGPDSSSIQTSDDARPSNETPAVSASPTVATISPVAAPSVAPVQASVQAPVVAPTSVPAPASTATDMQKSKYLAMLSSKNLVSDYTVTNAKGWGTSEAKRIEILVAVDDSGKAIVPADVKIDQIKGAKIPSQDPQFQTSKGPVTDLHSTLRVCNSSDKGIYLHAQGTVPFAHGNDSIMPGTCALFMVKNLQAIKDGDSYDHAAGGAKENWIYFKETRVMPDGSAN